MKKNLFLFAAVFFSVLLVAQSKVNLVVFSEDGDPFYTYVNGIRQNDKPETNVKITGISPNISLRIVFENKALPDLKQSMALEPGFEHTARIKKDTKKQVKLRYFGQTPISDEPTPGVTTVQYHTAENPVANTQVSSTQVNDTQVNQTGNTTITSSTTTTTRGNAASDNVNVNVNMAGVGITMNVTGMDNGGATQMNTTSSTTVTSTSSSSGHISDNAAVAEPVAAAPSSGGGCSGPMSQANFANMKKTVESKPFSDTKMSTAKVATKNACLTINQVKEICKLFSMDEEKLEYAKYAYGHCVDKTNYYQVSEVFTFSNTTEEFNKFLEQ